MWVFRMEIDVMDWNSYPNIDCVLSQRYVGVDGARFNISSQINSIVLTTNF